MKTQFEWGARSALQKAIRRGNIDMADTALTVLFKTEPTWIVWRMMAIVPEEIWQLSGKNMQILDEASLSLESGDKVKFEKLIRNWVRELVCYAKNRDANGMAWLISFPKLRRVFMRENINELHARQWDMLTKYGLSGTKNSQFYKVFDDARNAAPDDPVRLAIIDAAEKRFMMGGMAGDKVMLAATAVLAATEPDVCPPPVVMSVDQDYKPTAMTEWPWYVYDMHTMIGKQACYDILSRVKWRWSTEDLSVIWFALESGRVNAIDARSFWWKMALKCFLDVYKIDREVWERDIKHIVKSSVENRKFMHNRVETTMAVKTTG